MKLAVLVIFICISLVAVIAHASSDVVVWQGQYYTGSYFNIGTYEFNFTVFNALTGGTRCYSNKTNLSTGEWGQWITEQNGVSAACGNASADYFLNININGVDQTPRRRLTIFNYLRKDVNESTTGNITSTGSGQFTWIDKLAQDTAPGAPPLWTLSLWVEYDAISGFSTYRYKDDLGMVRRIADNVIIGKNMGAAMIPIMSAVYSCGSSGLEAYPLLCLARADNLSTMPAIGITIENISASGGYGRVMTVGVLENVNTNAWTSNSPLYVSANQSGNMTTDIPLTPNMTQEIGTVLVKSATKGKIEVVSRTTKGNEFGTIQNIYVIGNSSSNNKTLTFNDGGVLKNLTWDTGTKRFEFAGNVSTVGTFTVPTINISNWLIDNGGTGFRFYQSGLTVVSMRINNSSVVLAGPGDRINLFVYGNITTINPAGGGGNLNVDGNANISGNLTMTGGCMMANATATRPFVCDATSAGMIFYNTTNNKLMLCNSTSWRNLTVE